MAVPGLHEARAARNEGTQLRQLAAKQLGVLNQGDIGTRGRFQVGIGNYGQAAPAPMQLVVSTPDSETV